jgi:hypothetical protein
MAGTTGKGTEGRGVSPKLEDDGKWVPCKERVKTGAEDGTEGTKGKK